MMDAARYQVALVKTSGFLSFSKEGPNVNGDNHGERPGWELSIH